MPCLKIFSLFARCDTLPRHVFNLLLKLIQIWKNMKKKKKKVTVNLEAIKTIYNMKIVSGYVNCNENYNLITPGQAIHNIIFSLTKQVCELRLIY